MLTMTTYGVWLRGDQRGWVDDGKILPANPPLETADRSRLQHPPYLFLQPRLWDIGYMLGQSLIDRLELSILALTIQTWHCHVVVDATKHDVSKIAKCTKDAVRYGLVAGRPIWGAKYDKRFCFDDAAVHHRVNYVERHNEAMGMPPRPWPFIVDPT